MSLLILVTLHYRWQPDMADYLFPIGTLLMLLGILLRMWAVISLGKFFTMQVTIFSNHSLINEGPYRMVRHPSYLGALIATLGFGLASGYVLIMLLFSVVVATALAYRIYVEEKALKEKFGEQWSNYSAKTYALIPWIL
jgi:protein-S-isoprenylcysteine O-methyltransferase